MTFYMIIYQCIIRENEMNYEKLASYAVKNERYDPSSCTDQRFKFEHDISAIIYTNAFKRMSLKSQIIVKPVKDHFRSRMIHTHEVKDIALAIGKALELNPGLIEAIALAHDLGHTPFGHAGEWALQEIIIRVLKSTFRVDVKPKDRHKFFHHASNSARILHLIGDITKECIDGVSTHSWNPWSGMSDQILLFKGKMKEPPRPGQQKIAIPNTYEAQIAAIADQLASINHDIEDIINGAVYTNNNAGDLRNKIISKLTKIRKKYNDFDSVKKFNEITCLFITDEQHKGYGRKTRIEQVINVIIDVNKDKILINGQTQPSHAKDRPIEIDINWGIFLDVIETVIRNVIKEEAWFVGRDGMAAAMISVAFNNFWPWIKDLKIKKQDIASIAIEKALKEESHKKFGITALVGYLNHFIGFCNDNYKSPEVFEASLSEQRKYTMYFWDRLLFEKARVREKDVITNLIFVIDFISGLTDRYCVQIFDDLYTGFLTQ